MIIVEYCRLGNLRNFLLGRRDQFIDQINRDADTIDITITGKLKAIFFLKRLKLIVLQVKILLRYQTVQCQRIYNAQSHLPIYFVGHSKSDVECNI